MRNILIKIAYCGADYCGFQVQKDKPTVAEKLQDAIEKVFHKRYDIKGCSRTDSGVHARDFAVSFKCDGSIPCDKIINALNVHLPADIVVKECEEVPEDFHARYNSRGKRYVYLIHNSIIRDPFLEKKCLEYKYKLNDKIMDEAARYFEGTHDFSAFCSAGTTVKDFVRTIYSARVVREGDMVKFIVEGDGFLYNMVRIMVGTLLSVSMGKIKPEEISEIIESKDRSKAGKTVESQGLYLDKVFY